MAMDRRILVLGTLSLPLAACAGTTTTEQRIGGAAVGAGTGAVVGGPVGAVVGGTVGAVTGPSVVRATRRTTRRRRRVHHTSS
jgi:osmotically inducible lipoprotein OsmB